MKRTLWIRPHAGRLACLVVLLWPIALMAQPRAGSAQGLHLVVTDIDAARDELASRGVDVGGIYHFDSGKRVPGPEPQHADYGSFLSFSDPDGNGWLVQEVRRD